MAKKKTAKKKPVRRKASGSNQATRRSASLRAKQPKRQTRRSKQKEKLSNSLAEIEQYGIVIDKQVPTNPAHWPFDDERFEGDIFFDVLASIATEGWASSEALPVGSRGFHLDYEGIYEEGDYARIVEMFAFISGQCSRLSEVEDRINVSGGDVFVSFKLDDEPKIKITPVVKRDWVCVTTVATIARILAPKDATFCGINCGQSESFFCFPKALHRRLSKRIKDSNGEARAWS